MRVLANPRPASLARPVGAPPGRLETIQGGSEKLPPIRDGEPIKVGSPARFSRQSQEGKMSDKIILELTAKELEVLREELDGSDSDAPEITAIVDRLNDLSIQHQYPDAAEPPTPSDDSAA